MLKNKLMNKIKMWYSSTVMLAAAKFCNPIFKFRPSIQVEMGFAWGVEEWD